MPPPDAAGDQRSSVVTGDLRSTLFFLALPVLLEQFLSFCVGFFDTFLSGRISGNATAAVGFAAYVGWLGSLLFSLVGTGTTALVARFWGAGDFAMANRVANRSIALAALMGLVVLTVIWSAAPFFASLMSLDGPTAAIVVRYLRIDAFGFLFYGMALVGAAALRGSGNMRAPMMILGFVSICNVIASPLLVFGPGPLPALGVDGIVGGTVIARVGGGLIMLAALARGLGELKLVPAEMVPRGDIARRILRIGVPAALDGLLMWGGHFAFLMIIGRLAVGQLQAATLAAHMIGIQVEAITYLPAIAWGYASATMIGQSLGAGDRRRALQAGHEAVLQCSLLAFLIATVFFFGAEAVYSLMHESPRVRAIGAPAFRLLVFFQVPLVISIIYAHSLRGAGDTRLPMLITLLSVYGIRLPVAWYCGLVLQGGLIGAWTGMFADVALRSLLIALRYARGRWRHIEV
jgi:putative MATE family efflux protein